MKLSLRNRLLLSFSSIIILFVATVGITSLMNQRITRLNDEIQATNKRMETVQRLNLFARTANDEGAHYLLAPDHLKSGFKSRFDETVSFLDTELKRLKEATVDPAGIEQIEKFNTLWSATVADKQALMALADSGQKAEAQQKYTQQSFDPVAFSLLSFVEEQQAKIESYEQEIQEARLQIRIASYVLVGLAVLLSVLIAYLLSNYLISRIRPLIRVADSATKGDLRETSLAVRGNDELADLTRAFSAMTDSLRSVLSSADQVSHMVAASSVQLQAGAEQTSSATKQIADVMQNITEGTERQANQVEHNLSVITGISNQVQNIARNSEAVMETVETTFSSAEQGKSDLTNAIRQVRVIENSNQRLGEVVDGLRRQVAQIGEATQLITEISSQTNLLALNAAIEAARAGEQGRGFSIVANEVRKLAEQSRLSADQIHGLVLGIQQATGSAATEMEYGTQEVRKGIDLIEVAGDSFEDIIGMIEKVKTDVREVTDSTVSMLTDAEQAVSGTSLIADISRETTAGTQSVAASTEQQRASMEEIADSATSLADLSDELKSLIGQFSL
ncbi:methyl-accepting chemotaxis protein [Saccharibacillus alkalitolerans]|uniref:HAMP domain-containing protein n=1 Tax=Saccharibacillus alkalitolerans TaxID=2705290 RepID=A0ABX0FDS7_9BACL|nr:methyl-accepting chemotaxis protein [Saccharibacillus alkalitolerans]NGZ77999.1 HAMP domain-containing protein [Saccharibacillus alkalitolerans]